MQAAKLAVPVLCTTFILGACSPTAKVGPQADGSTLVATGQLLRPAGSLITFTGRPVDLCVSADQRTVFALDDDGLVVIDVATQKVTQELGIPKAGTSVHGIGVAPDGTVWLSDSQSTLHQAIYTDGAWTWGKTVTFPKPPVGGSAYPTGFRIIGNHMFVCISRSNLLAEVDLTEAKVLRSIPVDGAPFDVELAPDGKRAWVSCWGGEIPSEREKQPKSSGTAVRVDRRGVVRSASLITVDLTTEKITQRTAVALQPMQILAHPDGKRLLLAHGNADGITVLDTNSLRKQAQISVKPDRRLPYGSMPNALALSDDGKTVFTTNGGDNAVAVVDLEKRRVKGFIPTGWYPGAIVRRGSDLWIADVKGLGMREPQKGGGYSVYGYSGLIQCVPIPDDPTLKTMTATASESAGVREALMAVEHSRKPSVHPIPEKLGESSPIEHVVYILKENRTYDQVLGDMKEGDGDPRLCIFGEEVTPNHHAISREFALLDNFYCNGVLSADGHSWAMEGAVTGYLEKSFGGFTRSYPYGGDDPINASMNGFLWDHVLAAGLTFQNFGEFDTATTKPKRSWVQLFAEHKAGAYATQFPKSIIVERMKTFSDPDFPGWDLNIPDQVRADIFLNRFAKMRTMANMTIIYLPQDHTAGTSPKIPTPRAFVADNDLAVGRIVDTLSHSKFWPKMAIFVMEDDPQNGFDHVDGHRSPCLVISPYARRKVTVSEFYNQTSVIHTMLRILGIRPLTSFTALSPVMSTVFTDTPDLTPYVCKLNQIPLDELNKPKSAMSPFEKRWADATAHQDLTKVDAIDDDTMNRILWHSVRGTEPYPAAWAGAHGRGLARKGLKLDGSIRDED